MPAARWGTDPPRTMSRSPRSPKRARSAARCSTRRICTAGDTPRICSERAFAGCRREVVLATKAGYASPDGRQDFSPDGIRRSLDGSLRRLRTDYVDLLQLHDPSQDAARRQRPAVLPSSRRCGTKGIIRAFGISAKISGRGAAVRDAVSSGAASRSTSTSAISARCATVSSTSAAPGTSG